MLKTWLILLFMYVFMLLPMQVHALGLPQRAQLQYVDGNGLPVGMSFSQQGGRYEIDVNINFVLYQMSFVSKGTITGNAINPLSYTDSRMGRMYAHATFDNQVVLYGKRDESEKRAVVAGPVYDIFALAWQLGLSNGQLSRHTYLTNGKKLYSLQNISFIGYSQLQVNGQPISISLYRISRGDDVVECAFAPILNNIPVRISYEDNGKIYSLQLKNADVDGKVFKIL